MNKILMTLIRQMKAICTFFCVRLRFAFFFFCFQYKNKKIVKIIKNVGAASWKSFYILLTGDKALSIAIVMFLMGQREKPAMADYQDKITDATLKLIDYSCFVAIHCITSLASPLLPLLRVLFFIYWSLQILFSHLP